MLTKEITAKVRGGRQVKLQAIAIKEHYINVWTDKLYSSEALGLAGNAVPLKALLDRARELYPEEPLVLVTLDDLTEFTELYPGKVTVIWEKANHPVPMPLTTIPHKSLASQLSAMSWLGAPELDADWGELPEVIFVKTQPGRKPPRPARKLPGQPRLR